MDQIWKTENFKEASYTFGALKNEKNSYVYFCVNFGHFSFNIFKTITIFNLASNYFLTNHIHVSMQREIDSNT